MITEHRYTILDKPTSKKLLNTRLCIINFNIQSEKKYLQKLISQNQQTTFWAVGNNYSREYVLSAGKLGIQNIVNFPIKEDIIEKFFNNSITKYENSNLPFMTEQMNGSKVLIVDDNELNIELLKEIISDLGAESTACKNPISAIELINKEKFNLILLDILMPEMSGFELAEIIKNSTENYDTRIIFISALSGTENIMNGYSLGACSYIEKPFSTAIVKAQIYNILKSEKDKKEEQNARDNFVATLTHDLKSPISAEINALKYLLKTSEIDSQNSEMISELLNSAKYMKQITDNILCHYRQKKTNLIIKKENTSFNRIVLECIEEMKYLSAEKNITIRYSNNIENKLVSLDKIEIKRVINNLITNSIEHSFKDSFIDIKIDEVNNNCIFSIQDYGKGINLSKYNKIFDEYMSLSKENKTIGFGLGLSICKAIIEAHNGEIGIQSAPNEGTKIFFSIPN